MGKMEDPFKPLAEDIIADASDLLRSGTTALSEPQVASPAGVATGRFHGFDLDEQPLVSGLTELPGEVVHARTTVRLKQRMVGADVVLLYERGDPRRPIIIGVLQEHAITHGDEEKPQSISIQADDDRYVVSAEHEIVLRCGDASITLTHAGKVLIKGNYILSRSSGHNKIKGAAIDIN
jgi:hypothetical protein